MEKIKLDFVRNEVEVSTYGGIDPAGVIMPLDGTARAVFTQVEARQVAAIFQRFADTGRLAAKAQEEAETVAEIIARNGNILDPRRFVFRNGSTVTFVGNNYPERLISEMENYHRGSNSSLKVGDKVINSQNDLCEVMAIYTDGVDTRYQIGGRLLTSYDLIGEGYKRVTLVEGEE